MSYFMHVALCCLPCVCSEIPSVRERVGQRGPKKRVAMIYGPHTYAHTPEVTVGAWCITVIEADNAPTESEP